MRAARSTGRLPRALAWTALALALQSGSAIGAAESERDLFRLLAVDGFGRVVDWQRSNASIERTPPEAPSDDAPVGYPDGDPDALRFVLVQDETGQAKPSAVSARPAGRAGEAATAPKAAEGVLARATPTVLPEQLRIESVDPAGRVIDVLERVNLYKGACPLDTGPDCRTTQSIRAVADDVDRNHPLIKDRSIRAEVGGMLVLYAGDRRLQAMRVGGPRSTPIGPIERLRARLRILMVRDHPGGQPPFGGDDAGAMAIARGQIRWANALWGQCGISFGPDSEADVRIVDPPPAYLVAFGCDMGLPASGGEIRLRVDGTTIRTSIRASVTPRAAARLVAADLERAGFSTLLSENARIEAGAQATTDLLVRRKSGQFAQILPPADGAVSTDATLSACIGDVDLSDGLEHFTDIDAPAGTLEERTLIKAFDDGDPTTIDVYMIPSFGGGGRIGESFINADKSSVRNVLIEDRAGVRADRASFALAHELGHILLDMPGHPDDYGLDLPTLLMDSDSADPSAFGPRRLTLQECARAVIESGPNAQTPMLTLWPLREPASPKRTGTRMAMP